MKQIYRSLASLSMLLFAITANAQLDANFTYSDSTGCGTLQVGFCDASIPAPGGTITSWSWDLGGAPANGITCPNRVFGTPGVYTICLTVEDDLGNSDTECKSNLIQVYNLPTPEFSASPTTDCAPAEITFSDMSSSVDGNIEEWLWGLGGSCGTITVNSPQTPAAVCTYTVPDTYTISLTVKDDNGCENTITKSDYLDIRAQPEVDIATSSTFSCDPPFSVSFLNNSNMVSGMDFEWDFGNGDTFTGEVPPSITYNSQGSYTVTVIASDPATGCGDTLTLVDHITVGYPIDFTVSDTEGCEGASFTFTDNSSNVADNVSWDFGDGNFSTDPNPTHTYASTGCYWVELTRTVGGCVSTRFFSQCIDIQGPPSFNTNNDNNSGCSLPHVVNFSSISADADSWEWDFGDGTSSTLQNPTHSYNSYGDFDVYIIGENTLGCLDTVFVNTISVQPVEAILADDNISGCAPLEVTLSEISNSVTSITDWEWELVTTSNTFLSFSESPTFTIVDTGVFNVTLTITNTLGCTDTQVFTGAIEVGDNPTLDFSATPVESCVEQAIDFTDLSDNTVDYWFWDFGDGNDAEEQNPTHFYLDTGYYDVNLIAASNGCFTSITFDDYIHITAPVSKYNIIKFCDDNLKRKFKNNAVGADSIFWDFGILGVDTDTSTLENPEFFYPASGTYMVTQTVFNAVTGCQHSRTEEVVITNPIADFTPSSLVGCAPLTITLDDISQDALLYTWSSPDGDISDINASSPSITFDTPGVYSDIQLIIKDVNNCRDTFVMTDNIYVNEIVADIVADPQGGCDPLTVSFTDNSNNLFNVNNNWSWDFGDGSGTANVENPTYTFNGVGEYDVTLTVTDSWGCTDNVVISAPVIVSSPTAYFESAEQQGCINSNITFSNISDGDNLTFEWDFGDGSPVSVDEYPEHSYTNEGVYTVCLTITDDYGCQNTYCETDYITIAEPEANFTLDNNFASCPPLTVNFENLSSDAVTYVWDFGDNSGVSTLDDPTHVYTIPGSFEVTLFATNAAGCTDTITFDDLVVLDGPEGDFTMSIDSSCAPAIVTLIGESVANYEYTWDSGNGIVQTSPAFISNDTITFTYNQPGIYTPSLSLENASGCFRTLPPIGSIHVSEITPEFGASETLLCDDNQEITFYNFSSSPDPITDVVWIFESGVPGSVNAIEASTTFPGVGSYDVTMIVDNGICSDTLTKTDYINIGPSPVADFTMDLDNGCEPLIVSFTDMSGISSGTIDTWNWDFGDGTTDVGQNPTHSFSAGQHTVELEVTSAEGCSNIITQVVNVYGANALTPSNDVAICIGETAQLNMQVAGDTTGSTFGWSPSAGLSCVNCLNPEANPVDTMTYVFTMTNAFGCVSTAQITVDVKPSTVPVVQITADTTICWDTDVQLFADAGTGNFTYEWDPTSQGLGCLNCPDPVASPSQLTTYVVTVTNDFGCSSEESVTVDVIDERTPFIGEDRIVCEGGSVVLDASFGSNPVWISGEGLDCSNCANPTATPIGPTTYIAQVTTGSGCVIYDTVFVDIMNPDQVDAGSGHVICNGETVLLSGFGDGSVEWSPQADLSNPFVFNPLATPDVTTTYYMTLTNGDCVITDSVLVEVTESTNIELEDVTICEGQSVELEVIGNADQFEWVPNSTLSAFDIANPIASPLDTTTYTLIAALGACYPDTETVVVNVIPQPDVDLIDIANYFPGQSVPVDVEVNGNGLYGYLWTPQNNISCVTCSSPTITPGDTNTYYIQVTDFETGCYAIDSISFNEFSSCPPSLIGVPNAFTPNDDGYNDQLEIFLSTNMASEGIVSFRIFDRWGAQMFESADASIGWDGRYKGREMAVGVYLYYIEYICPIDGSIQIKRGNVTLVR